MDGLRLKNGMAQLIVDGQAIGAVYYEFSDSPRQDGLQKDGILSGDPRDLRRAFEEDEAMLAFEDSRSIPIRIIEIVGDEGLASFHLLPGNRL